MATLKDVAREAGVSVALVSYYLNGSKAARMSDETRERIAVAVKKLKYRPNRVAQSLSTGRGRNIGMLVGNIADPYFGHLAEEALKEAAEHDYSLIFSLTCGTESVAKAVDYLLRNRIDALFSCCALPGSFRTENPDLPVAVLGTNEPDFLDLQTPAEEAFEEALRFFRARGKTTVYQFPEGGTVWNCSLERAAERMGCALSGGGKLKLEEALAEIAAQRPGAILVNGHALYGLLKLLDELPGYAPELVIGVDEFHNFLESPLISGGILTSTREKAQRGIQELIRRIENPELPHSGTVPVSPAKFIRYHAGEHPVMIPAKKGF